jgi:phospholipid/cholesterol/gamma-HCH transport system ATP-binding protein
MTFSFDAQPIRGGALRIAAFVPRVQSRAMRIRLDHVTHAYAGSDESAAVQVLDDVSLEIASGDFAVLMGASGSGKSTLLNLIGAVDRPVSGRLMLDDVDTSALDESRLTMLRRTSIGYIFQFFNLIPTLNVFENVAFPLRQRTRMSEEQVRETALSHLGMVGLRDRADAMPDQLSAGMCKRVAIARALALEARILIIDDFDSGIDGVRLKLLCRMLTDYQQDTGATLLVSTHSMAAARLIADRIAVIHEGRVVSAGPAGEQLESSEPLVHQLVTGSTSGPIRLRDV